MILIREGGRWRLSMDFDGAFELQKALTSVHRMAVRAPGLPQTESLGMCLRENGKDSPSVLLLTVNKSIVLPKAD